MRDECRCDRQSHPCATGMIAPPTIAMIMTPEPSPVSGPSSATPRVKMLGNMIELKKPTRMMLYIAMCPVVSIEIATSAAAHTAQIPSSPRVLIFCRMRRSDETSDHRAAPIEGDEAGRNFCRQAANLRLAEVVHQETSDRNLGADINENADRAEDQDSDASRSSRSPSRRLCAAHARSSAT